MVCKIYAAAITSITEGLPWVRAADVWHVSSILEHKAVFTPKPPSAPSPPQQRSRPISPLHAPTHGPKNNRNNRNDSRIDDDTAIAGDAVDGVNDIEGGLIAGSIGSLTAVSGGGNGERRSGARFCERVVGKTWSGAPAVVLRSLRVPGRDEAACTARWLRGNGEDGGGVFGNDVGWTDQRLRLLADEWRACTGLPAATAAAATTAHSAPVAAAAAAGAAAASSSAAAAAVASLPLSVPRPFMIHTGHVIVPFLNRRVREGYTSGGNNRNNTVIGHGVVLAVDRGVDWRKWESHLVEAAVVTTRCFERMEREGEVAERERVKLWREELLDGNPARRSSSPSAID